MAFIIVLFIQILQTIVSRAEDGTRTSRSLSTKEVIRFYHRNMFSSSPVKCFLISNKFNLDIEIRGTTLAMSYSSTGTSSFHINGMEGEFMGSRCTECV